VAKETKETKKREETRETPEAAELEPIRFQILYKKNDNTREI
jgi:hypothetical protein